MSKIGVAMLATAPLQVYLIWTATWLAFDTIRDRRTARAAAAQARSSARNTFPARRGETKGHPSITNPTEP
jgi:hypothetical protein